MICTVNSINQLILVMVKYYIFFAAQTEFLNYHFDKLQLKIVKDVRSKVSASPFNRTSLLLIQQGTVGTARTP
jgi:hypothetical protein